MLMGAGNPDDGPPVRFAVLGPVQVWRGEREVDPGSRQQRLILALLLARAGRPVGITDFVTLLWDERPPRSAVNIVHLHLGSLRRLFEPDLRPRTPGRWLASDAAGYRMMVDAHGLDLLRFRDLVRRARETDDPAQALTTYVQALELSRGPCGGAPDLLGRPVADFESVDDEYADLVGEATDLALRAGTARLVLPMLRRVAAQRPLDEAVQARLLLTLSAAGQQAEAIALYQELRSRLSDDLGIDPGRELQEAYRTVLRHGAPEMAPGRRPDGSPSGGGFLVSPAQLPPDLPHFTGRQDSLRRALALIHGRTAAGALRIVVIEGIPGVGKTSLATHLGYRLADEFPDGQLYADLRGLDPDAALPPGEVLQAFLHALGVRGPDIPTSDLARSGLYRSVLAERRVLIVLDNVRDADQVRPLLPGAPGSLVLVTSRYCLAGLAATHGAHVLALDVLPDDEARELVVSRVGSTHALADRKALDEIVDRCAGLPLALAVVAARALAHPEQRLSAVAAELRDAQGGLDVFGIEDSDSDLRAIFSWSYRGLSPSAARLFRLLALHPGPDVTLPAAASLAGLAVQDAGDVVEELARSRLVTERRSGRYGAHDLIAAYARELLAGADSDAERDAAADRLLRYYRRAAHAANRHINPEIDAESPAAYDGVVDENPTDAREAVEWFAAERDVLKAVMRQANDSGRVYDAWQLELTVQGFYQRDGWWQEWATVVRECLDAAEGAGDSAGTANMLRSLAGARFYLGDSAAALTLLDRALAIFVELGDASRESLTLRNLGEVSFAVGDHDRSVTCLHQALRIAESLGEQVAQVDVLSRLADTQYELGDRAESFRTIGRALAMSEQLDHGVRRSQCHLRRANLYLRERRYAESLADFAAADELAVAVGGRVLRVRANLGLGDIAYAMDDRPAARTAWLVALSLANDTDRDQEAAIRRRLAKLRDDTPPDV
ncbi:BTAD domain-containing putative transcriptional regulator [Verrucosispora sp. NA02020]|uniref:AfsR/SARP family transcriptional regulator n=1 Tax=Verrucosispora sp. NA02020 TaxID=2742132 RepID=UPI0015903ECC|nr:BTAD domain-containing putative transcriptional regulator [Verrucosispora sp. NA02020]QKW13701.1 tetratricopeptide repeat protein [Verrucosispora sp. NA02020]